ncbi:MAG: hypothetical protein VCB24_00525 [Pseudomonas sp.]|uniref:hypothetical protein n=1 Tax=Pseudomonas sp. TaxID=306 RepID=UPI003981D229
MLTNNKQEEIMKKILFTLLTLTLGIVGQANANVATCDAIKEDLQSFVNASGVAANISVGYIGNACNFTVDGINSFANVSQLKAFADKAYSYGDINNSTVVYGYSDGLGRPVVYDRKVADIEQIWSEK